MIKEYKFGSITISGKTYEYDVEVRWNEEVLKWWRKESHVIDAEDVKRAAEQNPETIVIGTGESGVAKVTEEAKKFIKGKRIRLIIEQTGHAIKIFNIINEKSQEGQRKAIGLFHLTC